MAQDARGGGGHGEGARRGGHEALGHLPRPRGQEERALLPPLGAGRQRDEVSAPPSLPLINSFNLINWACRWLQSWELGIDRSLFVASCGFRFRRGPFWDSLSLNNRLCQRSGAERLFVDVISTKLCAFACVFFLGLIRSFELCFDHSISGISVHGR